MRQPKKPTVPQMKLIRSSGLDPEKWLVRKENDQYLYLVDRSMEQRENIMIDKNTGEVVAKRMP